MESDLEGDATLRRHELQAELEAARNAGNEAEEGEIRALLQRLGRPKPRERRRRDLVERRPEESTLPVYAMMLPEEGLLAMLADVTEEIRVRGTLEFESRRYPVEVRLRGASTRHAAKKSYRVRFLEASPLERQVTYLKAEPMDHTMQQEKLSCDVFRAAGAWVSEAAYVNLFLNGRYEGVYLDIEPVRSPFKRNPGLDPRGTLIRAATFQHLGDGREVGDLRGDEGSLEELREFLRRLNRVERGEFESFVREYLDWPRIRDYLALQVICHRSEIEADDYFFYRDPASERWSLIPWDHNNGNWAVAPYGNQVHSPTVDLFFQSIQQLGWRPNHAFVLPSRIFQNEVLRADYLNRVEALTQELLLSGRVARMIRSNYVRLEPEYPLDPYRTEWLGPDPFLRSGDDLTRFARSHGERLLRLVEAARNPTPASLVINEYSFHAEAGWVELRNLAPDPVPLSDYGLVAKTAQGNRVFPCQEQRLLGPGEVAVIRVPTHDPRQPSLDQAPRRPGFDPAGGFLGLIRLRDPEEEVTQGRGEEVLLDFTFYGPRIPSRSYGRWEEGYCELEPTPGEDNRRPR
jgi:spore coat protein H